MSTSHTSGKLVVRAARNTWPKLVLADETLDPPIAQTDCSMSGPNRPYEEAVANAERLVLCWNEHDALVKRLTDLETALQTIVEMAVRPLGPNDYPTQGAKPNAHGGRWAYRHEEMGAIARAAIAGHTRYRPARRPQDRLRVYMGVHIYPAGRNSSGIRYTANAGSGALRADTLDGIKSLIRRSLGK